MWASKRGFKWGFIWTTQKIFVRGGGVHGFKHLFLQQKFNFCVIFKHTQMLSNFEDYVMFQISEEYVKKDHRVVKKD